MIYIYDISSPEVGDILSTAVKERAVRLAPRPY